MNELVSQLLKKNKLHCQKLISQLKTEPEEVVREIPVEIEKIVIKEVPVEVIKEVEVVKEVEIIRNDPELEKKLSYSTMENQQLKEALNVSKKNLEIQRSINYELSRAKTLSEMEFNNLKDRFSTLENSFNTLDMENKNAQDKTRDEIKDKEEKISTLMKPVKHVKEQHAQNAREKEEKEQRETAQNAREVKKKLKERLGLSRSGKIISLKK